VAIPESQLETWAHQGSITQSSNTYNTIKSALESPDAPYANRDYTIFLQGSYGNDTNIYSESDVDIVICLDSSFAYDIVKLSDSEKKSFDTEYSSAKYSCADFKKDVSVWLMSKYGSAAKPGDKAIKIAAGGSRRNADVIVSMTYRRYYNFDPVSGGEYTEGICFWNSKGTRIANYPKHHSANCTTKHQGSNKWFKPMVRVLKNMRSRMIADKLIDTGLAPSYYIEGLLYNVPNDRFGTSYEDSFVNCFNWLINADEAARKKLVCANEQYYLLRDNSPVTWEDAKCTKFLAALREMWTQW